MMHAFQKLSAEWLHGWPLRVKEAHMKMLNIIQLTVTVTKITKLK